MQTQKIWRNKSGSRFFGAADAIVCMNRTVFPRLIDDKDLDSSVRPVVNPSHPETSSQPGPPAFPFAATGQSGRSAPRLKRLSVLDLVLVQRAGQSRTEAATQQLSRAQPDRRGDLNQPQSCLDAARARQTERKTERERGRKRPTPTD